MNKHIWIINEYAGSPYHGMEFRSFYLAKEWVKMGYRVTIVSSSYSHVFKNQPTVVKEKIDGVEYLWVKTLNYGKNDDKRRVLKWFIFFFKAFFLPFKLQKPDIILVSPMAPFPIFPAWVLAKIYNVKLIYEVKDIWPLSVIELGGVSPKHPFIKLMGWFENFALKKADFIVSNLQNYGKHIQDLGINRNFHWISNGVDLEELQQTQPLPSGLDLPKDKFIIGYTGSIGEANALEYFLQSAQYLQEYKDILLVVVGDGVKKEQLQENYAHYENVLFIDAIAKVEVQSMLALFDGCYIGLKKEKLFEYGVSPNKLYDYMYSAKPIIYAINSGKNIVDIAQCGISVEAQDTQAIVQGIKRLYNMKQSERELMGKNAKEYVLEHFTYEKLARKYLKIMER